MKNNKLLTIMLIILVTITLIGVVALVIVTQFSNSGDQSKAPSIDQIIEQSVDVPEYSTNLADNRYVKLSLKIQTDSPEAAEELTKRDFQINDILLEVLSEMTSEDLEGKKGKELLTNSLKSKFNSLMQDGEIEKVYITSYAVS